jgi:hypothetical protein
MGELSKNDACEAGRWMWLWQTGKKEIMDEL